MPQINKKQAKDFLEDIKETDKIAIIHHDDVDGFASGIIFYHHCKRKGADVTNIAFNIGEDISKSRDKTKEKNKLIICDLGPNTIKEILIENKEKEVFYTDHHKKEERIPQEIKELRTTDEGYIPSSRTATELTGEDRWLGVAGTLSDMGHLHSINKDFIESFLNDENIDLETFNKEVVFTLNRLIIFFYKEPEKAFEIIEKLNSYKEVEKLKDYTREVEEEIQRGIEKYNKEKEQIKKVNFFFFNPKFPVKSTIITKIGIQNPSDIIVFAVPKNESKISLSARTQKENENAIRVLKTGIKDLPNAGAGGHIPAAGGEIRSEDLERFKRNLKNYK